METAIVFADCAVVDASDGSEGRFPMSSSTLTSIYGDGDSLSTFVGKGLYRVSRI